VDSTCVIEEELTEIRLGLLDDLVRDTADPAEALTLRYINEVVGANAVWLQPLFPNNDRRDLPDPCDTLGSPYAVRDYLHPRGTLSGACFVDGRDEYSDEPCWADPEFDSLIAEAESRDMRVFLDLALNHFGHDYLFYDLGGARTVRDHLQTRPGEDLWDFEATHDETLLRPAVADSIADIDGAVLNAVIEACPELEGQTLVRAALMYRVAFDDERASFACGETLEQTLPTFYLGADNWTAARAESQTTNAYGWRDVKFLFHRSDNPSFQREFLRVREYAFRIINYWASRGVRGFRLDHATDEFSGMSPDEWRYIMGKVEYYAALRGDPAPIWLAEEFHWQDGMAEVADILTEGFLFGMTSRDRAASTGNIQGTVESAYRFDGRARVLTHLENHDELRLMTDTGWDAWTGAGMWSLAASAWSTPLLLVGQEWGETARLEFRRPHYLPGRFNGSAGSQNDLTAFYATLITTRAALAPLRSWNHRALRPSTGIGAVDGAIATLRWDDSKSIVLAINNLWPQDRQAEWAIPSDLRAGLGIGPCDRVQFADVLTGAVVVSCTEAANLERGFRLWLPANQRVMWAEMQECGPAR
jgi:glycosidase